MALGSQLRRPTLLAATLALLAAFSASPARADRCEDIAKELKSQIDGIKVSVNTGKMIYLSHPAAKEMSLGCRGVNRGKAFLFGRNGLPGAPANPTPESRSAALPPR